MNRIPDRQVELEPEQTLDVAFYDLVSEWAAGDTAATADPRLVDVMHGVEKAA